MDWRGAVVGKVSANRCGFVLPYQKLRSSKPIWSGAEEIHFMAPLKRKRFIKKTV
jgi:hypothetical protein